MTEFMFRLINKGKIVGYYWDHYDDAYGKIIREWSYDMKQWIHNGDEFTCDDSDLGIKVGDEWTFDGDLYWDGNSKEYIKVAYDEVSGFSASHCVKEYPYFSHTMGYLSWDDFIHIIEKYNYKRIGTIYDEVKP